MTAGGNSCDTLFKSENGSVLLVLISPETLFSEKQLRILSFFGFHEGRSGARRIKHDNRRKYDR